jgi:hypothetical protein
VAAAIKWPRQVWLCVRDRRGLLDDDYRWEGEYCVFAGDTTEGRSEGSGIGRD